ncbi:extracellular solute-binding protein [Stenotrophomonas geniculata]|uniref:extracellular solute-binding protein n=1 Tax=Stenotrophomonas geniculata TaxID=86188 RepID=UPI003AAFBA1A
MMCSSKIDPSISFNSSATKIRIGPCRARLLGARLAIGLVFLVLLMMPATALSTPPVKLTILGYGVDDFDKEYIRTVVRPFELAHPGVEISYYPVRDSRRAMEVLDAQSPEPVIDIVIIDLANAAMAKSNGLLARMDARLIPNASDLKAYGRDLDFFALPLMYDSLSLIYAKSAFSAPPRSWRELWSKKYRHRTAISTSHTVNSSMIGLTVIANRLAGGADGAPSLEPGLRRLERLGPNVLTWKPQPSTFWLVSKQEALLAVDWNSRGQSQARRLGGYALSVPREGTIAVPLMIARVAGRPNGDMAQRFINHALSPRAQAAFCESMFYAPSNRRAKLSADAQARVPLASQIPPAKLIPLDWTSFTLDRYASIGSWWQRRIIKPEH